jgi:ketosteroid isomerase-like protein
MLTRGQSLQTAFDSRNLDQLVDLLDERVIWRDIPTEHSDRGRDQSEPHDEDEHEHLALCTDRHQVRDVFEQFMTAGGTGSPVALAESGDSVVVDPQPEPPLEYPLHQAFTFRGERVVLIQDYPDRPSAFADLGRNTTAG